jgi:hypothetical protein
MVVGINLWWRKQNYGCGNKKYCKNNKMKVMNKYLGAKYSYLLKRQKTKIARTKNYCLLEQYKTTRTKSIGVKENKKTSTF